MTNKPHIHRTKTEIALLLTANYPLVHRLASGLCGGEAGDVTRRVFTRSLHVVERWEDESQAESWFLHHTVLTARLASRERTPLWPWIAGAQPQAQAFMRAFASLPFQQREALILSPGENLDIRRTAVAMDCSTTAATNHLAAAVKALKSAAGDHYETALKELLSAYSAPPPPADLVIGVRGFGRAARRKRIARALRWLVTLLAIAALAWAAIHFRAMFHY